MTARQVPSLFAIDERIEFERWLGRFRKQVSWKGEGIQIRWRSGECTYAAPGALISKGRSGIAAIITPKEKPPA